jgi:hypothetical protein
MAGAEDFLTTDELRISYGKEVTIAAAEESMWNSLMGTSDQHILKTQLTTESSAGSHMMSMIGMLEGDGVEGNTDLDSNEDTLSYLHQKVDMELFGNSVKSKKIQISNASVAQNFKGDSKRQLATWGATKADKIVTARLTHGCTNIVPCHATNGAGIVNGTASMVAGDIFSTETIRIAKRVATRGVKVDGTLAPRLRPYLLKREGAIEGVPNVRKVFVMAVGGYSAEQLKNDPLWIESQKFTHNKSLNNLFTGQLGVFDDVILVDFGTWTKNYAGIMCSDSGDYGHYATGLDAYDGALGLTTELNLFLGATAGLCPMDSGFEYSEDTFDYGKKMGVAISRTWAFDKAKFVGKTALEQKQVWHGQDYGVILVPASKE